MKAAILEISGAAALEDRLLRTLRDLAALGDKRAGSPSGEASAAYVLERLRGAGLEDAHLETFAFPAFAARGSSLIAGGRQIEHVALAYSGCGTAQGRTIHVATGEPADYDGRDVRGRIVIVERNVTFHRSAQYREAVSRGASGLIYVSHAPGNLVQIGTIADPEDGLGPIPAVSVGESDGRELITLARAGGEPVSMRVDATVEQGWGRNVVGTLPGSGPALLVGAHHDTWYTGSTDNGTGISVLIELAGQLAAARRRRPIVFVAYDAEELGLFGGYDFLRKHVVERGEKFAAFVNLEIPGAGSDDIRALAHTHALEDALRATALDELYPVCVGMETVPALFGGVIPTDIQGAYRWGIPGASTACDTPWYHTAADTPDKVDVPFLARATARWRRALAMLDETDADALATRDAHLWSLRATARSEPSGLSVYVRAFRPDGSPAVNGRIEIWLDVDDFTRVFRTTLFAGADGTASVTIPRDAVERGWGGRYVHITAGETWPMAESIIPIH